MANKTCPTCKYTKNTSEFGKLSKSKDGYRSQCKECRKAEYAANPEPALNRAKLHYLENRDYKMQYARDHYSNNREAFIKQTSEYKTAKRKSDPIFNFKCLTSSKLRTSLTGRKVFTEKSSMYAITGLTGAELVIYLHSTFEFNYGLPRECINLRDVEIDHIIPLSTAQTVDDVKRLNHYSNLQLLFKEDNQAKGTKIPLDNPADIVYSLLEV